MDLDVLVQPRQGKRHRFNLQTKLVNLGVDGTDLGLQSIALGFESLQNCLLLGNLILEIG